MSSAPPIRVFLVEDHDWLRETQTYVLDLQDGITVCGAVATAEEALDVLPSRVDVVLADIRLPGMSGLDLIRTLRERRPDVACLALSAQPAVEVAAAARDAGALAYVEKGNLTELLAAILAAADSHE